MSAPLLATKLYVPPLRPNYVRRLRLLEKLNEGRPDQGGFARKLTLISAPAGFGKTTLLSDWVAGMGQRTAWLSLDKGDNDPNRFLVYLIAALQTVETSLGQGLLAALQSSGAINLESVLTTLLNEIVALPGGSSASHGYDSGKCLVLILDDYHVIDSQPIDQALTFLLDHLPGQMHLVIASRTDPLLPLSRLRAREQLTELREAELRFTSGEAIAFLEQVIPLPISPDDARTLEERTEGWITGLQLAAVAMKSFDQGKQITDFVHSFGGSHRYIIDYLVDEVLDQQTPQVQEFLLQTSILDRLTSPLCNAVRFGSHEPPGGTGAMATSGRSDSQSALERLEAANLFLIPLDGERRWFRYHHLFADLLRQRLYQTQPDKVSDLHCRASAWYARHGFQLEAVHHALSGGDFDRAAGLVETAGMSLIGQGAFTTVRDWIEALPDNLVQNRPYLCVYHAWTSNFTHHLDAIEPCLQHAQRAMDVQALPEGGPEARDLRGHIATLRAWNARRQRDNPLAIELLSEAIDCLGDGDPIVRTFADLNLGLAYLDEGQLAKAADSFRRAVSQRSAGENELASLMASSQLAAVLIAQGRLHEAAELCRRTIEVQVERHGKAPPTLCLTYLRLGWVLAEWNDIDGFYSNLSAGVILADQMGYDSVVRVGVWTMTWEQQLLAEQGTAVELSEAVVAIVDRVLASEPGTTGVSQAAAGEGEDSWLEGQYVEAYLADDAYFEIWPGYSGHARASRLVEAGRVDEALDLLARIYESARAVEGVGLMIEARSMEARIHHARDDMDPALDALADALALAEPEGYVRTFVDRGEPMAELLRLAADRGIMPDYSNRLLAAFEGATKHKGRMPERGPSPLVEPLSQRELEVLELVAQGLSNLEIGERLFLALNTVKGHNRRIYGKLGVQRRTEAVARARELGLL